MRNVGTIPIGICSDDPATHSLCVHSERPIMTSNSFNTRDQLTVGEKTYEIHRLDRIEGSQRLPYSLKVLLENLLRNEDGRLVTAELVIDHSVIADVFARSDAFGINAQKEFERNQERYQLLRWAQESFTDFLVVPPDTGICHQVNLEYLSRVVFTRETVDGLPQAYPDTLVGTDSHTPMVNGLGVLGWGVGGIEAEAAMLGQPMSMLIPEVVGLKLTGQLPEGTTATDLVLTVAQLLRQTGVVGKFVEFFGPGVANIPLANRATLGNMSPEYGATCAIFPIDEETLEYLRLTGRAPEQIDLVAAYAKEQGLWHDPDQPAEYSQVVELDLATVTSSIAGPKRPQDRIELGDAPATVLGLLAGEQKKSTVRPGGVDDASADSFPASDPISVSSSSVPDEPPRHVDRAQLTANARLGWPSDPADVVINDIPAIVDHGDVVIAAITSCTNTSNPSVMIGAGLLAKKAVERGLRPKPWVKTTLAPGSRVVTDYFDRAGLTPYLDQLGFGLIGYGCTTCIGNSGPLIPAVSQAVNDNDLNVSAVLSGNRNFEGRIHPEVKMNFLASPPLVIAYALAGSMHTDLLTEALGVGEDGREVFLRDIWPTTAEIKKVVDESLEAEMFTSGYSDVFTGDENWRGMDVPAGDKFAWNPDSSYVRRPPHHERSDASLQPLHPSRVLAAFDGADVFLVEPVRAREQSGRGDGKQRPHIAQRVLSWGCRSGPDGTVSARTSPPDGSGPCCS